MPKSTLYPDSDLPSMDVPLLSDSAPSNHDEDSILDEAGLSQAILRSDIGQKFTGVDADTSANARLHDDVLMQNFATTQDFMADCATMDTFESWLGPAKVSDLSASIYQDDFTFDIERYLRVSPTPDTMLSARGELGSLKPHRATSTLAQCNANLVLRSLRAFPSKMIDREDPPFFIHGYKHRTMPEPLLVCSRICHMFDTRTPDILPFLWRCIRSEEERFLHDVRV
jgi:hypothetical protein